MDANTFALALVWALVFFLAVGTVVNIHRNGVLKAKAEAEYQARKAERLATWDRRVAEAAEAEAARKEAAKVNISGTVTGRFYASQPSPVHLLVDPPIRFEPLVLTEEVIEEVIEEELIEEEVVVEPYATYAAPLAASIPVASFYETNLAIYDPAPVYLPPVVVAPSYTPDCFIPGGYGNDYASSYSSSDSGSSYDSSDSCSSSSSDW